MAGVDVLIAQEAAEEAARTRAGLSGKALRAHLIKSSDELKAEEKAYRAKAEKDVGASKDTIHTLGNIAKNELHFIQLCGEWNAGKPGVRKTKLAYERLRASEKHTMNGVMQRCWNTRPLEEGDLKQACLARFKYLKEQGDEVMADKSLIQNEITEIAGAVKLVNQWNADSQMERFFPGHGGFRKQQVASEKVRAIERRLGGKMDKAEIYKRWPCLQPGWPDELGAHKLDFEIEIEARERQQRAPSPSLAQAANADQAMALAKLNDKHAGREETQDTEPEQGGYEGEQAEVFDNIFGDEDVVNSEDDGDGEDPPAQELSPSLEAAECSHEETGEEDGAGAIPRSERVDRRFNSSPDRAAPILKRVRTEDLWDDAAAAGGFGGQGTGDSSDSEDIQLKKRRTEIDGLDEQRDDPDDSEGEREYY